MNFDVILENSAIYDGNGRLPYNNDIGILEGRIEAVGNLSGADCDRRIDATGKAVCPGFIDVHTHADMALHRKDQTDVLQPLVRQGITTIVGGNCGVTMGPISDRNPEFQHLFYEIFLGSDQRKDITWTTFGQMLETMEDRGLVLNCAMLAPHGIIRMHAMADSVELADSSDIEVMKDSLRECMESGAFGMSSGLQYFPGLCSDDRELLELGKVVHEFSGIYAAHLRSYNSDTLQKAIDEITGVGRDAEIPVQVSHLFWVPYSYEPVNMIIKKAIKAASRLYNIRPFPLPLQSSTKSHLGKIADLVDQGQPVGVDAMPTSAGFTHLFAFFPPWALEGGMKGVLERISNPRERARIRSSIENGKPIWPHRGPDSWSMNLFKVMGWDCASVMSVTLDKNQHLLGKNFGEIGKMTGKHPFDAACDLAIEESGKVLIFETPTFPGDPLTELSLQGTLVDPNVSIGTDMIPLGFGKPSHLTYDCFPKFLGQYAREWNLISMQEAIRKCTGLPAKQVQIPDRGQIRPGAWADLVVFDPKTIGSNSTAQDPAHYPSGIEKVFINGQMVVEGDEYRPELMAGHMLRRV